MSGVLHAKPNHLRVFDLLSDYKPHFCSEFRDRLGLLEYRRRITDLRKMGYRIASLKETDSNGFKRPAYQLLRPLDQTDFFAA